MTRLSAIESPDVVRASEGTVSVVMATYNYAHFIGEAIQSVQAQTWQEWELIVVDDGSSDGTERVVRQFLTDHRIRYVRQENQGQSAAENTGVRLARCTWVAFLDADDRWEPTKLEQQLQLAAGKPGVSVIYADKRLMGPDGVPRDTVPSTMHRGSILREIYLQNPVPFSSAMVKREVLLDVGLFDPTLRHAGDYDLWLKVAERGYEFDYVPSQLLLYRTGHPNLTSNSEKQLRTALGIMRNFSSKHPDALPRPWVRRCFSETYGHLGMALHSKRRPFAALMFYFRAIWADASNREAWGGIVRLTLPDWAVQRIRAAMLDR